MKTQRTTREQNYQQHRRNLLHEAGIPQIEVPVDREPTAEEEEELNRQIKAATEKIRQAQQDGRLPPPLRVIPESYSEPAIQEYRKVLVNGLPVYS
jgi:hypothetical protein